MNKKIFNLFLTLLVFVVVFDPANKIFKLKEIMMVGIFIIFLINLSKKNLMLISNEKTIAIYFLFGLFLPFLGVFNGIIQDTYFSLFFAVGYIKSFMLFFMFLILININNDFERILIRNLYFLAFTIIFIYVGLLLNNSNVIKFVHWLFYDVEAAKIGPRTFGDVNIMMVFYKTAPLLFLVIGYIFSNKINFPSVLLLTVVVTALVLSGTRANMFMAILMTSFFIFLKSNKLIRVVFVVSATSLLIVALPFIVNNFLNLSETSNAIKLEHITSYIILFNDNPLILLFGQGVGSGFYSFGFDQVVQQTELVYLDLLRMYGLFLFSLFIFLLIYPLFFIYKESKYKAMSLICYLIVAGTNPLLISSTGILVIVYMYFLAFKIEMTNKYRNYKTKIIKPQLNSIPNQ